MALSIIDLIARLTINESQHKGIEYHMLSVFMPSVAFSYCYTECRYAECRGAKLIFLNKSKNIPKLYFD